MSDFHAIGGVSATLQTLLRDRMEVPPEIPGGQFEVTVSAPQGPPADPPPPEPPRVNLFLYRVTENAQLKNQEIPGHGHPAAFGRPPLSLDLHYLLTVYGTADDSGQMNETVSHFLLGSAMRALHDHPVIDEGLLTAAGVPILHASLRNEFERVKVSIEPLSIEDLSKVWTAITLPYRISAAYLVSAVQIESRRPRSFPKPVGEPPAAGPRVFVVPLKAPRILEVRVRRPGDPPALERRVPFARIGDVLILRGAELGGGEVKVFLGEVDASAGILDLRPDRLEVTVPDHPDLQPGAVTVAVRVGTPELPQTGFHSNQAVFMLVPKNVLVTPHLGATPRRLQIDGERLFLDRKTGETLIGETAVARDSYLAAAPASILVPVPDTLPAWPVDCLVSGDLVPFPVLLGTLDLSVTIGADGPHLATLPFTPASLEDAAVAVARGVRQALGGGEAFRGARVAALPGGSRLAVVPGGLRGAVTMAAGPTADALELSAGAGGAAAQVFLSGRLVPFPGLTANPPRLEMTIGADTRQLALGAVPTSLAEAASLLETAIRAAGPPASFADARVGVLGEQLLIVPGVPAAAGVSFQPILAVDETTVVQLQLRASYAVRVRVNGAEDLDNRTVPLP